ncbi:hypothetical protein K2X05_13305 [bacterium]|nr:hypothetical protein [bacterium]
MKKIVFAAVLAFSTIASAQWGSILPSTGFGDWYSNEFTSGEVSAETKAEAKMIVDSKNVKAYLKQNNLGKIVKISKAKKVFTVTAAEGACEFQAVIRDEKVLPVKNTLVCGMD